MLENIENNADLDPKLPTQTSQKGLKGSARWSLLTPGSQRSPRRWAGLTSTVSYARSMGDHSRVTTRVTAVASTRTVLRSKIMGAQVGPSPIRKGLEGTNFVQLVRTKIKKAFCKHTHKDKKRCTRDADSDSDSDNST